MTQGITWYDVLGVTPGASGVTVRRAHDERVRQLRCYVTPSAHLSRPQAEAPQAAAPQAAALQAAAPPSVR